MSRPARKWRLNVRAAIILGLVVGLGVPTLAALGYFRGLRSPRALLRQAEAHAQADPPRPDLALAFLNEYLSLRPSDFEALDRKSELLMETARSGGDFQTAADACQQALVAGQRAGRKEDDPALQDLRRRQVEAFLAMAALTPLDEVPLNAAEDVARALIAHGAADPEALRLLARTLEFQAVRSDNQPYPSPGPDQPATPRDAAIALYEQAHQNDPGNVAGARELAAILLFRNPGAATDPQQRAASERRANATLDATLAHLQRAEAQATTDAARAGAAEAIAEAHLARFQIFATQATEEPTLQRRTELSRRATAELDLALSRAPENVDVLLTAAGHAVQLGATDRGAELLAKLPPEARDSTRARLVQGLIELGGNQPDAAIESWRQGLQTAGGTDVNLTWQLANVLLDLGRLAEAEPLIRQHRRLSGGREPTPRHRLLEALYLLRKGRPTEALEQLQPVRYQADTALLPQVYLARARAFELRRDIRSALEQYELAARARPRWSVPYLARASLLERTGDQPGALQVLEIALADLPDDPGLLVALARGRLAEQLGQPAERRDWSEVQQTLDRAAEIAPETPGLARTRAELAVAQGDPAAAAELLSQAVRHTPKDVALWTAWAAALTRSNQPEQALIVLQQAASPEAAGDRATLRIARARLLAALGRGQQARETLTHAAESLPAEEQAEVWAELGTQLRARGQLDEAETAVRRWAALRPADPQPLLVLLELAGARDDQAAATRALEALRTLDGADGAFYRTARAQQLLSEPPEGTPEAERDARLAEAATLIEALQKAETDPRAIALLRGMYHERRDEPEPAIAAYEQALDLGGTDVAAGRLIALYTRLGRLDDIDRLRDRLDESRAGLNSSDPTALDRASAVALLAGGRAEAAESIARRVVAGDPASLDLRVWQAQVLNTVGKPEEAEESLRELATSSTDPGPWLALLFFQVGRGQLDEARATVAELGRAVRTERPELLLAQCYRILGDNPAAEEQFRAARARTPDDPAVARALSAFYEATGRLDEAAEVLQAALKADPQQRWAARALALIRSQQGAWDEAVALASLPENQPDGPEERFTRALVLSRSPETARQDEALTLLEDLVADLPPENRIAAAARDLLVNVYASRGQDDKLRALTALGAAGGTDPRALALHAEALLRTDDLPGARRQFARLQRLAPEALLTAKVHALLLRAEGQPEQAIQVLETAFNAREKADADGGQAAGREILALLAGASPNSPPALPGPPERAEQLARRIAAEFPATSWMLGRMLARAERFDEALAAAAAVVEADPKASPADRREAASLATTLAVRPDASDAQRDRAEAILKAARAAEPTSPELMILEAFLRHAQQRYEEEVALYRQARDANPPNPLFLNNMAWSLSENLDAPQEALEVINSLLASLDDPASRVQCLDTRAVILIRLDRTDEAIDDLKEALKSDPRNPVYHYHLARAYRAAEEPELARAALDQARQHGLTPERLEPAERAELAAWDEG